MAVIKRRKPRKIDEALSAQLQSRLIAMGIDLPAGWELYVVDQRRGMARSNIKTVTVPKWALTYDFKGKRNDDFCIYYAAHEFAHAWTYDQGHAVESHGPNFYENFKRLCPVELWHHERGYKTREAKKAGISADPNKNIPQRAPVAQAAGPEMDADAMRAEAIRIDPKLKTYLTNVDDRELKSYLRGWFQVKGGK